MDVHTSTVDEVIARYFGGKTSNLCEALAVSKAAVSYWRKSGIPDGRKYQLQVLTQKRK